jgi:hypothetical protein
LVFNHTFTAAGVRQVMATAEQSFKSKLSIFMYQGSFNPASSCSPLPRLLGNTDYSVNAINVLAVDEQIAFEAATYYFLVTSADATAGRFSLQILGSIATGTTTSTGPTWNPVSVQAAGCTPDTTVTQNFGIFSWQQTETGNFDMVGLFERPPSTASTTHTMYWALYNVNLTATDIALPAGGCSGRALTSIRPYGAQEGDQTASSWNVPLTINIVYTVVISNTYNGPWGFQITRSRIVPSKLSGFEQPMHSLPCANSTFNNASYAVMTFTANGFVAQVEIDLLPSWFPTVTFYTYSFGYEGDNSAALTCGDGTNTRLIAVASTTNTSGPLTMDTTPGLTYTVIISSFDGLALPSNLTSAGAYPYLFNGIALNQTQPAASATSTGSAATTGADATTGVAGADSSSSSSTTGNGGSTTQTSAASSTVSAAALLLLAILALL